MNLERRALLDHAARCRRVADGIRHAKAAERLRFMAQEYEARAGRLADDEHRYPGGIGRVDREPGDAEARKALPVLCPANGPSVGMSTLRPPT